MTNFYLKERSKVADNKATETAPLQVAIPPPTPTSSEFISPNFISPNSFIPNVKLDVKTYPTFNGESAQWAKFKRGVLSIASTHGLDDIFDENYIVPTKGDPNFEIF